MPTALRYRQVHLDFHTSEHCEGVGADFDADVFAETLEAARVNSINIFARCHHGYSYYPTKVGTMHPNLKFDLLGQQIEALHRRDIRCPIYVTVRWDELAGKQHPEWVVVDKEGKIVSRPPLSGAWGWTTLDYASGYYDYLEAQVDELIKLYEVDGFWFDICFPLPNYSPWGQAHMLKAGVRVDDDDAVWEFARKEQTDFFARMTQFVHSKLPDALIFYNGTMNRDMRRVEPYMTHLEVESLPTTGTWGYLHYPMLGRQARTYGKEFIGMNGRFHSSWGDFGGLKTSDQLDYECGTILAAGGKVCVGDQLHPRGVLDPAVYRLIGRTFSRIEALEPWLIGAQPAAEIGLLAVGPAETVHHGVAAHSAETEGAAQMLLELGYQFDIIDPEADVSAYQAVVLPDKTVLDSALQRKLHSYLAAGGRLILSGTAAFDPTIQAFQLEAIPVRYLGPAPTIPSYLRPDAGLIGNSELADDYDYAFYDQAHVVQATSGASAYGELRSALFNRTWEHFISHQHAPVGERLNSPVVVRSENVLYFAAPLFSGYRNHDYWAYRALVQQALSDFLPPPLLKTTTPGWAECSLHTQDVSDEHPARKIVHVVCYHPRRTMQSIQHVDQSWATAGMWVGVQTDKAPQRVYIAPGEQPLSYRFEDGYVQIEMPPVGPYTVIVVE